MAKYYRNLNTAFEAKARAPEPTALPSAELKAMIQDAIAEAVADRPSTTHERAALPESGPPKSTPRRRQRP